MREAAVQMDVGLAVSDDGLNSGPPPRFPLYLAVDTALLPTDLRGPARGNGEGFLQTLVAAGLAPDFANDPAQAGAQELDLPVHPLELLGVGVAWLHARLDSRPKYYTFEPYLKNA